MESCRDTKIFCCDLKFLSLSQAPVVTLTSCLGRLGCNKGPSVSTLSQQRIKHCRDIGRIPIAIGNQKKTTLLPPGKPLSRPSNHLQPGNHVVTQRTMSRHREPCRNTELERSIATKKTYVATQTRKWAIASLGLFCTSNSFFFFLNTLNSIYTNLFISKATWNLEITLPNCINHTK